MGSNNEYEQQQFWNKKISYIPLGYGGLEYQIQNSRSTICNYRNLTMQDIIDFIKALENKNINEN